MTRSTDELLDESTFREVCEKSGGEWGEYVIAPGGHQKMGCKFGQDTVTFHDGDPMTGEGGVHVQVDTGSGNIIATEMESFAVEVGERLDLMENAEDASAKMTFTDF